MKRVILMLLMGLSLVSSAITGGTMASFTTTQASVPSTFASGTLTLASDHPSSAMFTLANRLPGSSTQVDLRVDNAAPGNIAFSYLMTISATDTVPGKPLTSNLRMTVQTGTCASPTGYVYGSSGTPGVFYDGSAPYMVVFGNAATGMQAGDRQLNVGQSEQLCITVSLPTSAGNDVQGGISTATFSLIAEQL